MFGIPDPNNYIFRDSKIYRILHAEVSGVYEFYSECGSKIGEVTDNTWENNLDKIKEFFINDSIPCLSCEDSTPCFNDGRDYLKMVDDFIEFGKVQEGIYITTVNKYKI